MNAIDAIGGGRGTAGPTGFSGLSSEDFTKIIFTELGKQDPLAPNDTNQLLEQIANIRKIQSDMDLTTRLNGLVGSNEFAAATGAIGRFVSGVTSGNERVSDVVRSVVRTAEGPVLQLENGRRIEFSRVDSIRNAGEEDGQ